MKFDFAISKARLNRQKVVVTSYSKSDNTVNLLDKRTGTVVDKVQVPYYQATLQWNKSRDIFGTCGRKLNLFKCSEKKLISVGSLMQSASKSIKTCGPITGMDWNHANSNILATSCIDTTCTIWDAEVGKAVKQLIAHDCAVHDVSWDSTANNFATVAKDGSIRCFDLRNLEHSSVIFEHSHSEPITRVEWNKLNTNYVAVTTENSIMVVDVRMPSFPASEVTFPEAEMTTIQWSSRSPSVLVSGGSDGKALLWDFALDSQQPIGQFAVKASISDIHMSKNECIISYDHYVKIVKI